jgi:hypothetical protein
MSGELSYFPATYEEARERFRASCAALQPRWTNITLDAHALADHTDLTTDWCLAEAQKEPQRLLMITSGLHGVEGYTGAAVLRLFVDEFAPRLDPATCGLLLVHAVNPWGMKHHRRTNPHNVDLNRNFLPPGLDYDEDFNPAYEDLYALLNPSGAVESMWLWNLRFGISLLRCIVRLGMARIKAATLIGQYRRPEGVYFGGQKIQEESAFLQDLLLLNAELYSRIVHLDMHTGYGPQAQMSVVNSSLQEGSSADFARRIEYPLVVAANPDEFYSMQGDMIEYFTLAFRQCDPAKRYYGTAFEFGTFGDSLLAGIRSLRATVLENQLHRFGARKGRWARAIGEEFGALFIPQERAWQEKALQDARRALNGILRAEGFLAC